MPVLRDEIAMIERLDLDTVRGTLAPLLEVSVVAPEPILVLDRSILADGPPPLPPVARLALKVLPLDAETLAGAPLWLASDTFTDGEAPTSGTRSRSHASATDAYTLLASGDRRGAANAFRDALAADGSDARAASWSRELAGLERRWSGWAYVYLRDSGLGGSTAAPILGGGQSAAQLAYGIDPLAARPLSIHARIAAANSEPDSAQLAAGVSWRAIPALSLAVERLVPVGDSSRAAWNLRVAGGYDRPAPTRRQWHDLSIYGELGIVGLHSRDLYGAGIVRVGERFAVGRNSLMAGAGAWASVQRADSTVSRLEAGPSFRFHLSSPAPLDVIADYRIHVAGNAKPGSGPVLTIVTGF